MESIIQYIIPLVLNITRYFLLAGIPFVVFYIIFPNTFLKAKIQRRIAKRKDFLYELRHSMQTTFILAGVALLINYTPLKNYTQIYTEISDYSIWWIPISVVLALIVHDTYFYWMHRTVHQPTLFRHIHLVHHKSNNPTPLASYSFHFFEGILEALAGPIVLMLIPMHPLSILLFVLIGFVFNVYGHLGYEIMPMKFRNSILFEIMNTSTHHNIHHEKSKGNYGLYFRFWDRMMGTEHPDYIKEYDKIQRSRFELTSY